MLWVEALGDGVLLGRVDVVQVVLWAVMVSLAAVWESLGVVPSVVVGHSQGEIAAACVAGVLSLGDGARVVALRSREIVGIAGLGGMASVALPAAEVEGALSRWGGRLSVAAVNGPSATVVSGDADALSEALGWWKSRGVRVRQVPVDYASHSSHVEALSGRLAEVLEPIRPRAGRVPFFSTVEGGYVEGAVLDAGYWFRNLRQTVRLESAVRSLVGEGFGAFVEVSPHPVLVTAVQETVEAADASAVVVGSLRRDEGGLERFLTSAAELFVQGVVVDWSSVVAGGRRVSLPTYAFQRERFWLESGGAGAGDVSAAGLSAADHPLLGAAVHLPGGEVVLTGRWSVKSHPWLADHAVHGTVLLPGTGFVELAVRAGDEVGAGVVEELTLEAPLVLPAVGDVHVQVAVGDADEAGRRTLSVHSRAGDAAVDATWTRHASGTLTPDDGILVTEAESAPWPPPGAVPVPVDDLYDRLADRGLAYGPAFQGLRAAWLDGDDVLAEVDPPARDEGQAEAEASFVLDPALLAAALHLTTAQEGSVPVSWHGVRVYATGGRSLRVRVRPAGPGAVALDIADTAGAPVARIESVVLGAPPAARPGTVPTNSLFRVEWVPVRPTEASAASAASGGIALVGAAAARLTGLAPAVRHPDLAALAASDVPATAI